MEQSADSFGFGHRASSGMGPGTDAVPFGLASPSTSEPFGASASPGVVGAASAAGQELESRELSLKAGGFATGGHAEAGPLAAAPAAAGVAAATAAAVVAAAAEAPSAEDEVADSARELEEDEALQEAEDVSVIRSGAPYTIEQQETAVGAGADEELAVEGEDEGAEGCTDAPEAEESRGECLQEAVLGTGAGTGAEAEGDEELTEELDVTADVLEARQYLEETAQAQLDRGVLDQEEGQQGQEQGQRGHEQAQEEEEDSYAAAKVAALMGTLGAGAAAGLGAPDGRDEDGQDEEDDAGLAALGAGEEGNAAADVQPAAAGVVAGAPAADEAPSTPAGTFGSQQPGTGSAAASPASTAAPHTPTGSMPRASTLSRSTAVLPPDVASLLAAPSLRGRVVSGSCIENMNSALDVSAAALAASNTSLDAFSRLLEQAQAARVVQALDGPAGAASAGSGAAGCSTTLCGKARSLQDALQTLLSHAMLLLSDVQANSDPAGTGAGALPRSGEEGAMGSPGAAAASAASPSAAKQRNHHTEASAMLEVGARCCGGTAGWLNTRGPRVLDNVGHITTRRSQGKHKKGFCTGIQVCGTNPCPSAPAAACRAHQHRAVTSHNGRPVTVQVLHFAPAHADCTHV